MSHVVLPPLAANLSVWDYWTNAAKRDSPGFAPKPPARKLPEDDSGRNASGGKA
jgi:hypothetical protein